MKSSERVHLLVDGEHHNFNPKPPECEGGALPCWADGTWWGFVCLKEFFGNYSQD